MHTKISVPISRSATLNISLLKKYIVLQSRDCYTFKMNLIRSCEHITWPFWQKHGINANLLVHKRFLMPLGGDDMVFTPNNHHVYIFETAEERKTVVWYRWSGLVVVNGELYSLFENTNLFESYAWLVHDRENKTECVFVKNTPIEIIPNKTKTKITFIGSNIDRDTGLAVVSPEHHAKCFTIAVKKRATVQWYELNVHELMKPPIKEKLNSSVILIQRWMRTMMQSRIPAMKQIKHRGVFKRIPDDVFALIEHHYHHCLRPRLIQCEFRFRRPADLI